MSGSLYVVGTPIGNLDDFSPRAIRTLQQVDFIAAEDTRVTRKLCSRFEIHTPLTQATTSTTGTRLAGASSTASWPEKAPPWSPMRACRPSPTPARIWWRSAVKTGCRWWRCPARAQWSPPWPCRGCPAGRFTFEGFLSMNRKSRREHLEEIRRERRTMVFYEAPHKLRSTLQDLLDILGDRRISLVRELTKIHEETILTTLSQAVAHYEANPPRGEFVLIVEGAIEPEADAASPRSTRRSTLPAR